MPTKVVSTSRLLRTHGAHVLPAIYVGRRSESLGIPGHPLANPMWIRKTASREERLGCLDWFIRWLDGNPDRDRLLGELAEQVRRTGLPLACWCGEWPEEPDLVCHAVELAKRVDRILGGA
jgi:hypothetical protein